MKAKTRNRPPSLDHEFIDAVREVLWLGPMNTEAYAARNGATERSQGLEVLCWDDLTMRRWHGRVFQYRHC